LTGAHVVADVSCSICNALLGWKYVSATEPAQRYKIGKFILETKKVVSRSSWEDIDVAGEYFEEEAMAKEEENGGYVVFDSEDEDECEDLFAGIWDAEAVQKRRSRKVRNRKKDDTDSSS